jgi:hypothetical protein
MQDLVLMGRKDWRCAVNEDQQERARDNGPQTSSTAGHAASLISLLAKRLPPTQPYRGIASSAPEEHTAQLEKPRVIVTSSV